jgi:hypothetical protein
MRSSSFEIRASAIDTNGASQWLTAGRAAERRRPAFRLAVATTATPVRCRLPMSVASRLIVNCLVLGDQGVGAAASLYMLVLRRLGNS